MNAVWALLVATAWGFAEATLFFLVPDVVLSAVAIADWKLALWCCLAATAGALAGGMVMYVAGRRDDGRLRALFLRIPGIGPAMLERVSQQVASRGFLAVMLGPLYGTPYKLYATEAGRRQLSLPVLMLVTIPARLLRFLAVTLLAAWLAHGVLPALSQDAKYAAWAVAWTVFYAGYFHAMRRRR
jgi:membrane protein YqaA with SNARE-associated domain